MHTHTHIYIYIYIYRQIWSSFKALNPKSERDGERGPKKSTNAGAP